MKVMDILAAVKQLKPSQYDDATLTRWLGELEARIHEDVWRRYGQTESAAPSPVFPGDGKRELLVPFPHDDLYIKWLCTQIDFHNGEFDRYNNSMMMFNAGYQAYVDSVNRANIPRQDHVIQI